MQSLLLRSLKCEASEFLISFAILHKVGIETPKAGAGLMPNLAICMLLQARGNVLCCHQSAPTFLA